MENIGNKEDVENKEKEEIKDKLPDKLQSVIDIFNDFFGEEYVDVQRNITSMLNYTFIYVWFPKVTITNEKDEFTEINDLYVKIKVNDNGNLLDDLLMTVTTYTKSKWNVGYMHSHLDSISNGNVIFKHPCLGTGPLCNTVSYLKHTADIDIENWEMFCLELSKYVHVESLQGIPYIYLNKISKTNKIINIDYKYIFKYNYYNKPTIYNIIENLLDSFIKYLLQEYVFLSNHFIKLTNCNYILELGENYINTNVKITNLFIKYIKSKDDISLTDKQILNIFFIECSYRNGQLYTFSKVNSLSIVPTLPILTFKNKQIYVKIIDEKVEENTFYLLNNIILSIIINKFLLFLNININGDSIKQYLCI